MKSMIFLLPVLLILTGCSEESTTEQSAEEKKQVSEYWFGKVEPNGVYRSEMAAFVARFPEGEVEYKSSVMKSEAGDVLYHTYIHSDTSTQDHMISLSVYPLDLVAEKGREQMLEDAFKGVARGMGKHTIDHDEDFTLNNLPCKRFSLNNGKWFMRGEQLMINERLYQKVILKKGKYANDSIADPFFRSFHLLE